MELVWPDVQYLPGYVHALQQGWSPDNLRPQTAVEHLARIEKDPAAFLRAQVDREAKGPPVTLPDNSTARRLPGYTLWMWDDEFCGSIGLRWQPGRRSCRPTVSGTSVTRSYRGSVGVAMPLAPCSCCCRTHAPKGCRTST